MSAFDIVKRLGGIIHGEGEREITFPCTIDMPRSGHITFLANKKYTKYLKDLSGMTIILEKSDIPHCDTVKNTVIEADEPQIYFGGVLQVFEPSLPDPQISERAFVHETAVLGEDVVIMPFASVGANSRIDKGAVLYGGVVIDENAHIGPGAVIMSGVYIGRGVKIGEGTVIDSGAKIGTSGFGFPKLKDGSIGRIPQIGSVAVGENVYIGANTTIDRGTVEDTVIGDNTKIDNLVQIAHNVHVGKNCLIIAQSGIAGSTKIGDNAIIAAQVGIVGHIEIGENSIIGAKCGVSKSVPSNVMYSGIPAKPHMEELKIQAISKRLPEIYDFIREVKKKWENE